MKIRLQWLMTLMLLLSLTLGACGGQPTEEAVVEAPPDVEEPVEVEEPAEPVDEPAVATPSDLDAAYGPFLGSMQAYNTITMDALAEELLDEPPPFLIDVRTVTEVEENGHIPGAVHAPLAELGQYPDLLPGFDTPIVTYCAGGWRATIAMTQLSAAGWTDVRAMKAKFSDWVAAGYDVEPGLPPEPVATSSLTTGPA